MNFSVKNRTRLAIGQVSLLVVALCTFVTGAGLVEAAAPGSVVINEIAWAGSADASNDEWLELYNTTDAVVDLSGWKLLDDGVEAFTFPVGATIAAGGYSVIEDSENVISNRNADFIYNMSLANTGDSLQLVDATTGLVDTVNASGGVWYAGSSTSYATMERKEAQAGDLAANFVSSTGGSGALASAGAVIVGTPGVLNSVSVAPANQIQIKAEFSTAETTVGQTVKLLMKAENVTDLFAYGYELSYDPAVLEFQSAAVGSFLSNAGVIGNSFQSGLKSGQPGRLLVAEARTIDPKVGRSGSGELFEVNFKVLAGEGTTTQVNFGSESFSASPAGDMIISSLPASLNVGLSMIEPVSGLQVTQGTGRYQIKLSWAASSSSPDHYRVERKDAHGVWTISGGVTATEFIDQDGVTGGGFIIPTQVYQYRVTAVKGALTSTAVEISAQDGRGLKGDNNRSDLVDGRDLERLARHFAEDDQVTGFDPLIDTTYDGLINGSDLIDIGAAFAQSYS